MNRASFKAFANETRKVTDYCIENPRASAINVVYMFRENLKQLLKREPGFNEEEWLAACRNTTEKPQPELKMNSIPNRPSAVILPPNRRIG